MISCRDKQLSQDELSNKFNEDWCNCLAKQSEGKTPEEIVEQVAVNCVLNVLSRYTKDKQLHDNILSLVAEKGYDDSLSDYEKEKLFGKELGKNLMADAIDYCVVYRQSLIQFNRSCAPYPVSFSFTTASIFLQSVLGTTDFFRINGAYLYPNAS